MAYDILKAALEKKKQQQAHRVEQSKADQGNGTAKDQVTNHKPAKKSTGRGR